MAIVTARLVSVWTPAGEAFVDVTYDDTDESLVEFVVSTPWPLTYVLRRTNGQAWRSGDIGAGTFTQAAGGPIQDLDSIPSVEVGMDAR